MIARLVAVASLVAAGCATLPDPGTCGNGIVEPGRGEACDDGEGSELCSASCELVCVDSGVAPEDYVAARDDRFCPAGYGCGVDEVCRAPSGRFRAAGEPLTVDIDRVLAGDTDGDDAADLVGTSDTRLHLFYGAPGDDAFLASSTQPLPIVTGEPFAVDLARDDTSDVLLPVHGGVIRLISNGTTLEQDIAVAFEDFDTNGVDISQIQAASAIDGAGNDTPMLILPTQLGPVPFGGMSNVGPPCTTGASDAGRTIVPGLATTAMADGSEQFAFAMVGPTGATFCIYEPAGAMGWDVTAIDWTGAYASKGRVVFANVDADACRELVFTTATGMVLAIDPEVNLGCHFSPTGGTPTQVLLASSGDTVLAAGDFDGAGRDELVTRYAIYASTGVTGWSLVYSPPGNGTFVWGAAVVDDLDGDGRADVAGARARPEDMTPTEDLDLVFGRGSVGGVPLFAPIVVETFGDVDRIVTGDFDANGAADVALVENRAMGRSTITIVHGNVGGFPDDPIAFDDIAGDARIMAVGHREGGAITADAYADLSVVQIPDVATATIGVAMLYGTPNRVLAAPQWFPPNPRADPRAVIAYPFRDPEGPPDAAVFGYVNDAQSSSPRRWFWPGAEDGTFTSGGAAVDVGQVVIGARRNALAVARTGGSPVVVLASDSGYVSTAYGTGDACASTAQSVPLPRAALPHVATADLDGDARDEIFIAFDQGDGPNAGASRVWIAPAIASGCEIAPVSAWLDVPATLSIDSCVDATPIDVAIDAAGTRELAVLCEGAMPGRPEIRLALREGADRIAPVGEPFAADGRPVRLVAGDFTGDGVEDLAVLTRIGQVGSLQLFAQCAKDDVDCE